MNLFPETLIEDGENIWSYLIKNGNSPQEVISRIGFKINFSEERQFLQSFGFGISVKIKIASLLEVKYEWLYKSKAKVALVCIWECFNIHEAHYHWEYCHDEKHYKKSFITQDETFFSISKQDILWCPNPGCDCFFSIQS